MIDINSKFSLMNTSLKRTNSGGLSDVVNGDDPLMNGFKTYGPNQPTPSPGITTGWVHNGKTYSSRGWNGHNFYYYGHNGTNIGNGAEGAANSEDGALLNTGGGFGPVPSF